MIVSIIAAVLFIHLLLLVRYVREMNLLGAPVQPWTIIATLVLGIPMWLLFQFAAWLRSNDPNWPKHP